MTGDYRNLSKRTSKRGKGRELRNTWEGITEQVLLRAARDPAGDPWETVQNTPVLPEE